MKKYLVILITSLIAAMSFACSGLAQTVADPAMTAPDENSWTLFLSVNAKAKTEGNNNALFETWASDADTFTPKPVWPQGGSPKSLVPRALSRLSHGAPIKALLVPGGNNDQPGTPIEEVRRNHASFDYIVNNNLYKVSGLKAAFSKSDSIISFPTDAIEVKANWIAVDGLKAFNGFSGTAADAQKLYHVNTAGGKDYALVAMHLISKQVPNWTWATFEHQDNPGRCDVIGCTDSFGAVPSVQPPLSQVESTTTYPACAKTPALKALFAGADIDPAYLNYCLKGSQTDTTTATGLTVRLGNSVTEKGFVAYSSCITCHGRAGADSNGKMTSFAGFDLISASQPLTSNAGNAPIGPIQPSWFWVPGNPPALPMLADSTSDLTRIALAVDFVWSIPFCAIDDTASPPQTKSTFCATK
ncbi:hypothetical protein [Agrobacterium vitis]|uniref:hypothetical protein n=1 Tax=Agrobacterium vitis TaxID=373 RepID=UPI001572E83F|nr:hypothetical protein [Agrobacterium vitis]NSZ53999.1 hypothetical protein [Agrobacterium vitis]NTA32757.1 hypothetical protein [Agrobacterium vitis]